MELITMRVTMRIIARIWETWGAADNILLGAKQGKFDLVVIGSRGLGSLRVLVWAVLVITLLIGQKSLYL